MESGAASLQSVGSGRILDSGGRKRGDEPVDHASRFAVLFGPGEVRSGPMGQGRVSDLAQIRLLSLRRRKPAMRRSRLCNDGGGAVAGDGRQQVSIESNRGSP